MTMPISGEERGVWAALASDLVFGARHFDHALSTGRTLLELWNLPSDELRSLPLPEEVRQAISSRRQKAEPSAILGRLEAQGITFLTRLDEAYPEPLRQIAVPPAVLYLRGTLIDRPVVAVVGTRKMSPYGRRVTEDIVEALARAGIVVVSGLALGVDGAAHRAALKAGGVTWAILPGGVDNPYPASHRELVVAMIEQGGAALSEFPPGTPALKHHFPIRNRIIAGLARAVIVIEAAEQSGTLLTARSALESNRDVLAVPGSIYAPGSAGPHHLIQLGAKLIHKPEDVLLELGLADLPESLAARQITPDSAEEAELLGALTAEPILLDDLIASVKLDAATVSSTLTLMEMKGRVKNLGGNMYVRR